MPLATNDFAFLRDLVARHSGNVIAPRHAGTIEQRLAPIVGSAGVHDVRSLVQRLRVAEDGKLSAQVAEAVTVNETRFFRDANFYDALRRQVIPDVMARNASRRKLRIWSAACSSGQEPYSIAMLLREHFPELAYWSIQIVASDLSEEMLHRVRAGVYSQLEVGRGLSRKHLMRYFDRKGSGWQVGSDLRDMVDVHHINLAHPWPYLGQFDIALVRNVLIYFNRQTKTDILKRVRGTLRPEGYLFIGAAETLIGLCVPYQRKEIDATISYRPTTI